MKLPIKSPVTANVVISAEFIELFLTENGQRVAGAFEALFPNQVVFEFHIDGGMTENCKNMIYNLCPRHQMASLLISSINMCVRTLRYQENLEKEFGLNQKNLVSEIFKNGVADTNHDLYKLCLYRTWFE